VANPIGQEKVRDATDPVENRVPVKVAAAAVAGVIDK
jgi:hypothetical protein